MEVRDIENKKAFIEQFQRKAEQCMRIRVRIARQKTGAIAKLLKNVADEEGINTLSISLGHDKKLLWIVEEGLSKSSGQLEEIYYWVRDNVKDREMRRNTEMLLMLVKLFHKNLCKIKKRMAKEELFINSRTKKSFDDFIKEWKKEINLNRKLLKKAAGLTMLNEYFKKTKILLEQAKLGLIGGTVGPFVLTLFYIKVSGEELNERMAIAIGMTAFISIVGQTLAMLAFLEREIEKINLNQWGMVKA